MGGLLCRRRCKCYKWVKNKVAKKQKALLDDLLTKVKANLIVTHDEDNSLLENFIKSAIDYAENFQHVDNGSYMGGKPMPPATEQGVIMLASHFYESRDGSTAGFFADSAQAGQQVWEAVNNLLRMGRQWKV